MKRAIVLSGGGAKGAYQIGVWKALRRLHIKYDIVTGTSIGSVNGLMMVQKRYFKAKWLWKNIGFDELYEVAMPKDSKIQEVYIKYAKEFIKNGGIETGKMYGLLEKIYDKNTFYNSNIDYGLVTFNLTLMKPEIVKKKDNKENIIEYVLASSTCFPAFKPMKIGNSMYIDGGYYDNLPINLALDLGAEEVIAVDLNSVGVKGIKKDNKARIIYISPNNNIGSFLVFDSKVAAKSIKFGYNDTMKKYNKLDGKKYTFRKNSLVRNNNKYRQILLEKVDSIFDNKSRIENIVQIAMLNQLLVTRKKDKIDSIINEAIEYLGNIYNLEEQKIYYSSIFNWKLKKKLFGSESMSKKYIHEQIKNNSIKELLNMSSVVKYIYELIKTDKYDKKEIYALAIIFPKEFIGAIYLSII